METGLFCHGVEILCRKFILDFIIIKFYHEVSRDLSRSNYADNKIHFKLA